MRDALKARDLQRDPRFALHSASEDPDVWVGDAKLAGMAEEFSRPDADSHRFRLDLQEVSTVGLDEGRKFLLIDIWKPGEAVRTIKRA